MKPQDKYPGRTPKLIPRYIMGVVVLRVPKGTPPDKATSAQRWAKNLANKINNSRRNYW